MSKIPRPPRNDLIRYLVRKGFTTKSQNGSHVKLKRQTMFRHIHLKGDKNNNKMERLNGEIRDREKVFRGLKKIDTPVRGHESLL